MIDVSDPTQDVVSAAASDLPPSVLDPVLSTSDPTPVDAEDHLADDEYSPIDLDLYGQPFALNSPPLQDISTPPTPASLPPPLSIVLEAGPSKPMNQNS